MNTQLESLVTSMLFEGYALYPYTPEAAKNSTPTPFGIVYPSSYAAQADNTYDHLQVDVAIEAPPARPCRPSCASSSRAASATRRCPAGWSWTARAPTEFEFGAADRAGDAGAPR